MVCGSWEHHGRILSEDYVILRDNVTGVAIYFDIMEWRWLVAFVSQ